MDKVKIIDKNKKTEDQTNDQDNKTAKNSNRSDKKDQNTIVLPGEELIESLDFLAGHGTYREDTKIYSKVVGLLRKKDHVISVIPLSGIYMPKPGDYIIGEIDYVAISNWKVNIRYPLNAILPVNGIEEFVRKDEDLTKYYKRGDIIFARIDSVTKSMISQLSMKDRKTRKLFGGRIIEMTPLKIPRLIGKEGTMISQIKNKTGCIINVGQNGRVWLKGNNMDIAINTIKMVEKLSHKHGLTNIISDYLDNELKNNKLKKEKP